MSIPLTAGRLALLGIQSSYIFTKCQELFSSPTSLQFTAEFLEEVLYLPLPQIIRQTLSVHTSTEASYLIGDNNKNTHITQKRLKISGSSMKGKHIIF